MQPQTQYGFPFELLVHAPLFYQLGAGHRLLLSRIATWLAGILPGSAGGSLVVDNVGADW